MCNVHAGPAKDIFAQTAGPLMHIPQAGLWLLLSVFTARELEGSWAANIDHFLNYNHAEGVEFAHTLFVAAFWVRVVDLLLQDALHVCHTSVPDGTLHA